jgi:oligoendopeptidase F
MKRSEIDPRYTFDLESIFPDAQACQTSLDGVERDIPRFEKYCGRLAESASVLLSFLEFVAEIETRLYHAFLYAFLRRDIDRDDREAQDLYARALTIQSALMSGSAWQDTELAALSDDTFTAFCGQQPALEPWRHFHLEAQRRAKHRRSDEVEAVLAEFNQVAALQKQLERTLFEEQVFPSIEDEHGEQIAVTPSNLKALTQHADREVRRRAWASYRATRQRHRHSLAAYLNAFIKCKVIEARQRGYALSLEAALDAAQLDRAVFEVTLETFECNQAVWHEFWEVKRKLLGLDILGAHDLHLNPEVATINVPYEQAVKWLLESLAPMGDEYVGILRRGLTTERWVDVYPTDGKARTEYSWTTDGCKPFILLQYHDDIRSLSALAHESGHAMHSHYMYSTQPHQYATYGQTAAEVAANFHQAMLFSHLLETHSDPNLRLAILLEELNTSVRYLMRMPINARFELELYDRVETGGRLDADRLAERYRELDRAAFGSAVAVADDDGIRWADQGVLYEHFYSFQYALGLAGGQALAERIRNGEVRTVSECLRFFSSGASRSQLESLALARVDFRTNEPLKHAFERCQRDIRNLAQLIKS